MGWFFARILSSKIISLGEEVNPLPYVEHSHGEEEDEDSHSEYDPHIWLDPLRASQIEWSQFMKIYQS